MGSPLLPRATKRATDVRDTQCCGTEVSTGGGGWAIFNALLGWTNSASYGTVISYNMYWIAVTAGFLSLLHHEKKGYWPLMKPKTKNAAGMNPDSDIETPKDGLGLGDGPREETEAKSAATAKAVAA